MSFNSKQYLLHEERLLEPEQLRGNYKGHKDLRRVIVPVLPKEVECSEQEIREREDIFLKEKGIV